MYTLDTNVIINLHKNYFPETFIGLWQEIDNLIENEMVCSLKSVQNEVTSTPESDHWDSIDNNHDNSFYKELIDGEEMHMGKIESLKIFDKIIIKGTGEDRFEWSLKKEWSEGEEIADPLLICFAIHHNNTIVTTERPRPFGQYNIPHVCEELNIRCIGIKDFFLENRWTF